MIIVVNISVILYRKQSVFLKLRLTKSESFIQSGMVSP